MPQKKKEETIKKIEELLSGCTIAITTDYRGMTVAGMSQLRRRLGESGIEYHVVKNTLACLAAERVGQEELRSLLQGPSAIAFGYGEVSEPARALADYIRLSKATLSIKGGLLGKRVLSSDEVATLSSLPSTEVLISQLIGQMEAPISSLLVVLSGNLRRVIQVLQGRKQQLEGG